jgi:small subunit ribosomal protein S20
MPNTASAKKRMRQNEGRRARNRAAKSRIRTQIRKVRTAISAKDVATSESEFRVLTPHLDRAAAQHVIHANAAARTKSRLSKAIRMIKG